uniref:DNA-directed RNA polymerase III subunit n=1 Tax=Myripristis murdjan TaxID=586833 RepID=A0A667YZR0_9TELE
MAARGRGRGRRLMSFSVEAVGISRGESLPPSILQPTPLFPPMEQKPLPLVGGEEVEYMLALKQEFRGAMRSLPFFIQPDAPHTDVERYSDKYHSSEPADSSLDWKPGEAAVAVSLVKVSLTACFAPQTLEKKEEEVSSGEEEGEEKKKQEEEEAEGEEEYDEEEFEEETDYIMSYFDNGEEFAGDSDDNMDEAIY